VSTPAQQYPKLVKITEVGPRDGLQNESQWVPTEVKIELVHRLQAAGLTSIEVTSYVSPKWVPQMSDNHEVMSGIKRNPNVVYAVLTPNLKGYEAAAKDRPDEIVVFGSASEAFSQKNINCSIAESVERFRPVVAAALAAGIRVRGAMSCTVGCPYEGEVSPQSVGQLAKQFKDIGVQQIAVCDTIGVGTPESVQRAIEATLQHYPVDAISGHFHDTYNRALANTVASLKMGVWQFESSIAGLGGCPYAKGATGNVATEDVVYLLQQMGIETGLDLQALLATRDFINEALARTPKPFPKAESAELALNYAST